LRNDKYSLLTVIAGNFFRLIHHLPSTFSIKISGRMYEFVIAS
jgi:hypothetical protein